MLFRSKLAKFLPRPAGALAAVCAAALLLTASLPVGSAQTPSTLPPLGMSVESIAELKAAGAAPRFGSYWVGEWMSTSGWGGFESAMRTARAEGVTPVVYWYYWGDSIAPTCFDADGCDGRNEAEWHALTDQLVARLRTTLEGAPVLVVLENEFNKGGITGDFAPTFDTKLAAVGSKLKAVSGVQLVVGFGAWGESSWAKFPKTIGISEFVGFQMMRASTRDTEASYRAAADRTAYFTGFIAQNFQKPSFLYDVALSSYPDATWARIQAETLDAIFSKLSSGGSTGLQGVVYRSLNDHYMDPINYYGLAESHWGLRTKDGVAKPAFDVWIRHAQGGSSVPPPPAPIPTVNVPGSFEAEKMTATKGGLRTDGSASGGAAWNLWSNGQLSTTLVADTAQEARFTVRALGQSAGGVDARMEVRLGSAVLGAFTVAPGSYAEHVVDAALPAGSTTLAIAFTNDALVGSEDRNLIVDVVTVGAVPPPPPPAPVNKPPTASFEAFVDGLAAGFDGRASADPDGDALTYAWTFGDGATGAGATTSHTYAAGGDHAVTLTVSDGSLSATATKTITIVRPNTPPVAMFSAGMSNLVGTFDGSGSSDGDGDALSYAWSFGATGARATHEFPAPGTYSVELTVSDGKATSVVTKSVTATYPAPVARASASGTNATRTFDAEGSNDPAGGSLSYAWAFSDGTTATGARVTKTFAPGNHTATLTVTNRFGESATATVVVSVQRAPYAAVFTPVSGNAHWLQVRVDANDRTSAVCASIDGGACQPLTLKSWGDWAANMKVPTNARVTYTATSALGEKATSPAFLGASSKLAPPSMTATFTPHDGNNWWVQTKVVSNRAIASVCASIDGGACKPLELKAWGSWAASLFARTGAKVSFTATSTSGEKVTSPTYAWPIR